MVTISYIPERIHRVYDGGRINYFIINTDKYLQPNIGLLVSVQERGIPLYPGATEWYDLYSQRYIPIGSGVTMGVGDVMGNYVGGYIGSDDLYYICDGSYLEYRLKVEEYCGEPVSLSSTTYSDVRVGWCGVDVYKGYNYIYNDSKAFILGEGGRFLNLVSDIELDDREGYKLYCLFDNKKPLYMKVNVVGGGVGVLYTQGLVYDTGSTFMLGFNIGPRDIIKVSGLTSLGGWDYYDINLYEDDEIDTSPLNLVPFRVYRKERCSKYDFSELYFLNEHGGYDKILFNKKRYRRVDIDRSFYDKKPGYGYSDVGSLRADRVRVQFNTSYEEVITLSTDNIGDDERILYEGLIFSSDVYYYDNGVYIPCVVIDSEFTEYNEKNDKIYSYQVDIVIGGKKNIQKG